MHLPTPLEMGALGTAALIGAGLVMWFLKSVRIAAVLFAASMALFGAAAVANGYEAMGEAKIQPKLDAANARIANDEARAESFRQDALVAAANAASQVRAKNAELEKLRNTMQGRIDALTKEVTGAPVRAAAGQLLDNFVAEANAAAFGPGADAEARAAAAAARDATVAEWVQWGGKVSALYGRCASQVIGLQTYVKSLGTAADAQRPAAAAGPSSSP